MGQAFYSGSLRKGHLATRSRTRTCAMFDDPVGKSGGSTQCPMHGAICEQANDRTSTDAYAAQPRAHGLARVGECAIGSYTVAFGMRARMCLKTGVGFRAWDYCDAFQVKKK